MKMSVAPICKIIPDVGGFLIVAPLVYLLSIH